jgi:hypothetical protein
MYVPLVFPYTSREDICFTIAVTCISTSKFFWLPLFL